VHKKLLQYLKQLRHKQHHEQLKTLTICFCLNDFNVHQHINCYIEAAARHSYWLSWLRMGGEKQCETSLDGHVPIISTSDKRYLDKSLLLK
jgi:hypothetical protein